MTKDIFIKYLQGVCTEQEFQKFLSWINEGSLRDSGREMVEELWNEFEPEAGTAERIKYERLLDKIHHKINVSQSTNPLKVKQVQAKSRVLTIITRAAAVLLLPVLSLLIYTNLSEKTYYSDNLNDLEVIAPAGSRMQLELGDGTKVWLNHGSKLKYPYRFDGKLRKVFLEGEAYFKVAHNAAIPFIVGTGKMDVKATGTAFNVSAYPDDNFVETVLIEGKVILYESKSKSEIKELLPNESLKFNSQKRQFNLETGNTEKRIGWKDGLLVFKNDPVEDVAKKLARWYNIEVQIDNDKIKKYPFTATFKDETLPQVLELLSLATQVKWKLESSEKLPNGSFSKPKVLIK